MGSMMVLLVGKWTTMFSRSTDKVILSLEFDDREPLNLAIDPERAAEIGQALISSAEKVRQSPPPRH